MEQNSAFIVRLRFIVILKLVGQSTSSCVTLLKVILMM